MNFRRITSFIAVMLLMASGSIYAQVTVTSNIPASASPGSEFLVELTVTKPGITGFAKLQHELPTGFEASAGQTSNATFSFKDRKVKFLWMALPNDDTFTVSYSVKVAEDLSGNQILEGTFAYIKDNGSEKYMIPKDIITIGVDPAIAAAEQSAAAIAADSQAKEDAANAAREAAVNAETPAEEAEEATEEVVEAVAEEVAEEVDNSAAEEEAAAAEAAAAEAEKAAKEAELAQLKEEKAQREAAEEVVEEVAEESSYNDAMLQTKAGLVFRVQVLAGPNSVDPAIVASKLGLSENVMLEENEGMFKYVVGEFGSYRPAKTFSNSLRDNNGVEGPFVTAYQDGVRIHVKEALDIAGQ